MAKTLELSFEGRIKPVKIIVRNPKDSLTPAEVKAAMDSMIQSNIFSNALVSVVGARYIDRTTQDIELM
ncbi:DUF2922 domain-containing protein [Bacillus massilinigeriensis]|uniref:DUF2922 domain-containing protein n=1 Tax=Bacillus massilionigeriensis TaxID=1805475 RepID=UPI00096B4B21|nr:DUF2922 domain-containing protein [Bacillus massilionigeriensis]